MKNFSKPAVSGVAIALSLLFGIGNQLPRANAMTVSIFTPPEQSRPAALSGEAIAEMQNYDVVVLIDSSKSMSRSVTTDARFCSTINPGVAVTPDGQSRWQWCSEQTDILSKQLKNKLKDQLKVVVFSESYKEYQNVDLGSVPTFFISNRPGGMTNATTALRSQFRAFFAARDKQKGEVRPLLVAMITDGAPDDPISLKQVIIDATKKMHKPDEIAITFLQVGVDPKATKYLKDLDDSLVASNARYDIVTSKSFDQLNNSGLAIALLDAVHR